MTEMPRPLVLLVDDEVMINDLVAEAMSDAGYEIQAAHDGASALLLLDGDRPFRAVVTDVNLGPGPTGWDVARRAREIDPQIPVVYVSGADAQDWGARGVPGSTVITKPFAPAQIVTAVSELMNKGDTSA